MKARKILARVMTERKWLIAAGIAGWMALLALGALPALNRTRDNIDRLDRVATRQANLNEWLVAGQWLVGGVRKWESEQAGSYDRLFPPRRDREQLFLDLARVARQSGIEGVGVREETTDDGFQDNPDAVQVEDWEVPAEDEVGRLRQEIGIDPTEVPSTDLVTHCLVVEFDADYGRLTRFLEGLRRVPRALSVRELEAVPARDGVSVRMELEFYAQQD